MRRLIPLLLGLLMFVAAAAFVIIQSSNSLNAEQARRARLTKP